MPNIDELLRQLQMQFDSANTLGNEQYQNLLASVGRTGNQVHGAFDKAQQLMAGMGTTARANIGTNAIERKAQSSQDLTSRGLGNTTITSTASRGIDSDTDQQLRAVDEQVNNAQAGLMTQRAGAELNLGNLNADAILSRRIQGPESSMYANLIQALAANGGAGGGFGGGRTNSVVGGHPSGPVGGPGFGGSVMGVSTDPGVNTVTGGTGVGSNMPNGVWPEPGTPQFEQLGPAQRYQASTYWQNRRVMHQSSTGPVSYGGVTR